MRYLGANIGGGLKHIVDITNKLDMNSTQWMPSAPMRWAAKEFTQEQIQVSHDALKSTPLRRVLLHGIYLINLARGDERLFHLSKLSLVTYLNFQYEMEKLIAKDRSKYEILDTCFHPGSSIDLSEEDGLQRVIYGINWSLEHSKGGKLLIESTAGAGKIMGDTLEEMVKMREGVEQKERVGFVLDTQHMFASGYDWVNNLEGVVKNIDDTIGIGNVKCFHLNDSMTELGSHKDRHADLFDGKIGMALEKLINHPKFKNIPFIMETPSLKGDEGIESEFLKLKSVIK